MKILELSATELAKKIKAGEITSEEAAKASLAQIAKEDQKIRAYLTVDEEKVLARAKEVDNGIRSGKYTGPLAGVPIAVKDNICTKDMRTTCASKILENFVPFYDATAVTRITDAGMVILGKTNMDEFAMGSTTETSAFAVTKNPWDTEHVPPAELLLRRYRNQTDIRNGFPFWPCGLRVFPGPDRTDRQECSRLCGPS